MRFPLGKNPGRALSISCGRCCRAELVATLALGVSLFLVASLPGCENPRPTLTEVSPTWAHANDDVRLALKGDGFLPASILDPSSGRRIPVSDGFSARIGKGDGWQRLTDLSWQSTQLITATLSKNAARSFQSATADSPDRLDIELTDPRGETTVLVGVFEELGVDVAEPTVAIIQPAPDTPFAPGMTVRGSFHATTKTPGRLLDLSWDYLEDDVFNPGATCIVPSGVYEADCAFKFTIRLAASESGTLVQTVTIRASANAGNLATGPVTGYAAPLILHLLAPPTIVSLSPNRGGTAGGTEVLIKGTGFLPGTTVTFGDQELRPAGGMLINDTTLTGYTPPGGSGSTTVRVNTPMGSAETSFTYAPPPTITAIILGERNTPKGCKVNILGDNFSDATLIYLGSRLENAIALKDLSWGGKSNNFWIEGYVPPGVKKTTVWAVDWALGFSKVLDGYDPDSP